MSTRQIEGRSYPFEPIKIPKFLEVPTSTLAQVVWEKVKTARVKVTSSEEYSEHPFPDTEYGQQIIEHINRGGSVIFIANHESHIDHILLLMHAALPLKQRANHVDYIWATGSKLYSDYFQRILSKDELKQYKKDIAMSVDKRIKYFFEGTFIRLLAKQFGMNAFPVLQPDVKGKSKEFVRNVVREVGRKSLSDFEMHIHKSPKLGYFALEGGRDDGKLKPAVSGLETIVKNDRESDENLHPDNILYVPAAIKGTKDVLPKYFFPWDFSKDVTISIGRPFTSTEISKESDDYGLTISDTMMLHVVAELPPTKWGYYIHQKFKQFRLDHKLAF